MLVPGWSEWGPAGSGRTCSTFFSLTATGIGSSSMQAKSASIVVADSSLVIAVSLAE